MQNRTKNIIAWVIIAAVVTVGIYFFGTTSSTTDIQNKTAGPVTAESKTIARQNTQEDYTIETTYPVFAGPSAAPVERLNTNVQAFVQQEIDDFTTQVAEYNHEVQPESFNVPDLPPSTFHGSHEVLFLSPHLASVRFTITTYMSGAAHPFNYAKGFNYNIETGQYVTLPAIFRDNTDYIARLSDRAISTLLLARAEQRGVALGQQQEEWVREGAAPKAENFENWAFTKDILILYFNPYQVAPYAAGIIETPIPWKDLQGLIDKNGPIAPLIAS